MTYSMIAEDIGCSIGLVKKALHGRRKYSDDSMNIRIRYRENRIKAEGIIGIKGLATAVIERAIEDLK
jgi:hypothetical protein